MSFSFRSLALHTTAAFGFAAALLAPVAAQPTFDSFCAADPSASFITASLGQEGSRSLYEYRVDAAGAVDLVQLGEIPAPLNAMALYGGYLYGFDRVTAELYQVAADGSVVATYDPLQSLADLPYIAGTVNADNGLYYGFARGYAKMRVISLANPTSFSSVQFTVNGAVKTMDTGDLAYYRGGIYGYDVFTSKGFRADATTGVTELFSVDGLPAQVYPAMWVRADGTLVFYKTSEEVYEVSTGSGTWTVTRRLTGPASQRAQRDGASCPLSTAPPPPPPPADTDGDGIPDLSDNCPSTPNADQADRDGNGIGDACDVAPPPAPSPDRDSDGVPNEVDNCPDTPNADQRDTDGDGIGDACDDLFAACEAIHLIQARVNSFSLPRGTANQLHAKLDNADRKCHREQYHVVQNMMGAFVNTVQANYGSPIPTAQAAELLWRGQSVVYLLGNPPGGPGIIPHGNPIRWDHQGDQKDHGNGRGNLVAGTPEALAFVGVYPNPARTEASVRFALPESGDVSVSVYDVMGREVATSTAPYDAGENVATIDAARLPAGLYVVQVTTPMAVATGKLVVVR